MKSQRSYNAIKQKEKFQFLNFLVAISFNYTVLSSKEETSCQVLFPNSRETASKLKLLTVTTSKSYYNSALRTN